MTSIALIGLGAMGAAMALKWREAGFSLAVYNRTPGRAAALGAAGVRVSALPCAAAADADLIVSMVVDDDASRAVWQGPDGAFAGARSGAVGIECSTVSPAHARALAEQAASAGLQFLDAPVAGGPSSVAAGKLAMFVGGSADALDAARPALSAIAGRIEHLGGAGAGATWKLVNYMMAGAQIASLAEAMTLAAKAGIDPVRAGGLLAGSVVASPLVVSRLPRMVERRFGDTEAALRLVAKDQRYARDLATALGADLEIVPVVAEMFARAEREGLGDLDLAAVALSVARRSGLLA